jgi:hypothetical protein
MLSGPILLKEQRPILGGNRERDAGKKQKATLFCLAHRRCDILQATLSSRAHYRPPQLDAAAPTSAWRCHGHSRATVAALDRSQLLRHSSRPPLPHSPLISGECAPLFVGQTIHGNDAAT